ncbi:hypothetical protein GS416_11500 [Rhodococcus hoagii]|nr:hypothetical protein [Prescottella equi]
MARALRARIPVTIPVTTVTDTADLLDVWPGRGWRSSSISSCPLLPPPGAPVDARRHPPARLDTHGVDVAAALALARGSVPHRNG